MASVQVSFPFKLADGSMAEPGSTVELDDREAAQRVKDGHAKVVDSTTKKSARKATAAGSDS